MIDEEIPPERVPLPRMIDLYKKDLRVAKSFTLEEQEEYLRHFKSEQKEAFIHSCLWLPVSVSCATCLHKPTFWPYVMDFIQEGTLGLLSAIDYLPECEQHFQSAKHFYQYAIKFVKGNIYRYYARIPNIYIPPSARRRAIAKDENALEEIFTILENQVSLEKILMDFRFDVPLPEQRTGFEDTAKREGIEILLLRLPEKERKVIRLRYGLDGEARTYDEIARILGRTDDHVARLERHALKRLAGTAEKPAQELLMKEREDRLYATLQQWQEHGKKVNVREFAHAVGCGSKVANIFLREQNVLSRTTRRTK